MPCQYLVRVAIRSIIQIPFAIFEISSCSVLVIVTILKEYPVSVIIVGIALNLDIVPILRLLQDFLVNTACIFHTLQISLIYAVGVERFFLLLYTALKFFFDNLARHCD